MSWWSYGKGVHRAPRSVAGPQGAGSFAPAGGQVSQRPDQGSNPPQSVVAPTQAAGTLRARVVIISGTGAGVFEYSGTPGAGTLVSSQTQSSTDPFGNATLPGGFAVYDNSLGQAILFASNGMFLSTGSLSGGWTIATPSFAMGSNGSVVTGPLNLVEQAAPSPSATAGPWLFGDNTLGTARFVADTLKGDGNTYDTGRLSLSVASNFPVNSATPGTITGLSAAVVDGSYRVQGMVNFSTGGSATGILLGFSGPATSACRISTRWQTATSFGGDINTGVNSREQTSIGTNASPTLTVGTAYEFTFTGYITFSAGGTFAAVAAEAVSGQSSTVGATSFLDLMPVG